MDRACGYGRVSTDEESQLNALNMQIDEIEHCIMRNGWENVDMYVDEGKSGTSTKKRDEYHRLMNDMLLDKWDIIVVKSQDRLMRSAKDWYIFVDTLVKNNKKLFFYIENKFYTPDYSLITGIKAILAEDYSRELSKKEKNAHRTRRLNALRNGTNNGRSVILTNNTWGYNKVNKEVVINEEEADIVKEMFHLAAYDNYGSRLIAKHLLENGIVGKNGNPIAEGVIRKIIRNPLYKGTAVMNRKSYDFSTKQIQYNKEDDVVYIKDGVPRIIDDKTWDLANSNMDSRSRKMKSDINGGKRIGIKIGQNKYSGKVFCGECKALFWLKNRRLKTTNEKITEWYCSNYIKLGKDECHNIHISDEMLDKLMIELSKKVLDKNYEKEFEYAIKSIQRIISEDVIESEMYHLYDKIDEVKKRNNNILDKFVDGVIDEDTYKNAKIRYVKEIEECEEKLSGLKKQIDNKKGQEFRINKIKDKFNYIKKNHELDSADIINLVKKIIIFEDYALIEMELGMQVQIKFEIVTNTRRYHRGKTSKDIKFL